MAGRAVILGLLFLVLVGVLALRLFHLQVLRGDEYRREVEESRLAVQVVSAKRGRILDRNLQPLVDNRALYDLAVVLDDLELPLPERRGVPLHLLDAKAFDTFLAHLTARLPQGHVEDLRQAVETELSRCPGVALRQGEATIDEPLALVAVEAAVFAAAALANAQGEATDARLTALAETGLLEVDPRQALLRELAARRGQTAELLDDAGVQAVAAMLARRFEVPADLVASVLVPFAPLVQVVWDEGLGPPPAPPPVWRLLNEDGRRLAVDNLARFLGSDLAEVRQTLDDAVRSVAASRPRPALGAWYFLPSARADALAGLPTEGLRLRQVPISAPPARERVFVVQGESPGQEGRGMLTRIAGRLAQSLQLPSENVALLLRHNAGTLTPVEARRRFGQHHLLPDPQRVARLCTSLAEVLAAHGVEATRLGLEEALAAARHQADRGWRDQTRSDPLILIPEVPAAVAMTLDGSGAPPPEAGPGFSSRFQEAEPRHPGLRVLTRLGREYRFPRHASHLIGWLGRLNAAYDHRSALLMGLDPGGWIGRSGLEEQYDELLQGAVGLRKQLISPGGPRLVEERPPLAGADLVTTIDIEVQIEAERALANWKTLSTSTYADPDLAAAAERAEADATAAGIAGLVLVDCRDGAILALASTPGFDLADIRTRYEELADPKRTPGRPLHDHAAEGWEPPGSTVKPLIGLAAMMEGVYRPGESVTTRGYMDLWQGKKVLRDHRPYDSGGTYTMRTALKHSVNTFFATLAQRVGPEKLCAWHRRFGFGINNALDVGWQEPGILPTPATHRPWLPSDTWRMGIGQYCSASPLQLVTIAACIGNGGTIVRPYLNRDLAGRTQADQLDIPRAVLAELRAGMEAVTEPGGTASHLVLGGPAKGLRVAAKTGTSEWGSAAMRATGQAPDHAWLIGYAPADAPTVAFAIFIRCGMSGGRGCSGVAKRVLEVWFERHPPG